MLLERKWGRLLMMTMVVELFATGLAAESLSSENNGWLSRSGQLRLTYESEMKPIKINRIHSWLVYLETIDGQPLSGAEITMQGGMPEHNHGLPTKPQLTGSPRSGEYLIEGIRFHMRGHWELEFNIINGDDVDTVEFSLEL